MKNEKLSIEFKENDLIDIDYDLDQFIYDVDSEINLLSSQADNLDYLVSASSGVLSALLDILWVGEFDLRKARELTSEQVDDFVIKVAERQDGKEHTIESAVRFLEDGYGIPSDGNTMELGGTLQHHLRDFAHHPTIVGLFFSLLTQYTYKSYGTDTNGNFIIVNIKDNSKKFIGQTPAEKISKGTITWFFHLVSDMAGSNSTAGKSGGTGIPGPLLSLAKELSILPFFKEVNLGEHSLSKFLSKLYNGTLLASRDKDGKIIKGGHLRFDLRGEMGVGVELGRQAIPVLANEMIVRSFYLIRHLAIEMKENKVQSLTDFSTIDWEKIKPYGNPTITRMLTIATGVFTTIDVTEAVVTQKYWVSINYPGVGRFVVAIGQDVAYGLQRSKLTEIKQMYETVQRNTFQKTDNNLYERMSESVDMDGFGLTVEQTKILYNLEYHKTKNDIEYTKTPLETDKIKAVKRDWLEEWKEYISIGFPSFLQIKDAEIQWYSEEELIKKIEANNPHGTWFRLVLLEAILFEPYYPMSLEKNRKGVDVPSKKYRSIQNVLVGYSQKNADEYLDSLFDVSYYEEGYVERLRRTYNRVLRELNEVLQVALKTLGITAIIMVATVVTAGIFSSQIAALLVGSNFVGLSGAALTSASLAYLGGGAIAAGGAGMLGGTAVIVGGGALLGTGVGLGVGGTVMNRALLSKQAVILQSAKLLVTTREIFLNDEHDVQYSTSVYEQLINNITEIEKSLIELRLKEDTANKEEKKDLKDKIKRAEESVEVMKIARKNMNRFMSSFKEGLEYSDL